MELKIALKTEVFSSNFELNVLSFNCKVPSWFVDTPISAKYLSAEPNPLIGPVKILFILFWIAFTATLLAPFSHLFHY